MKPTLLPFAAFVAICMTAANAPAAPIPAQTGQTSSTNRNHMFYAGLGFGPTQLKLGNNERTVEGINFTFTADNNDAGGETHAGYWITDNIGIEVGARDYGTVKVPFVFSDPHDNTTGTGESEVRINGFIMSAVFGADITPTLQLFGHMGVFK